MTRINRLILVWSLLFASTGQAQVTITRTEPIVERKTFDPRNPPRDMPRLRANEVAKTVTFFGAETRIGGNVLERKRLEDGQYEASVRIESIRMTLKMTVTLWLPLNVLPKTVKHEEGHQKIAEHFYHDAEKLARAEAETLFGKTITAKGKDEESAVNQCFDQASQIIGHGYLARTDGPSGKAQEEYDRITVHGTNAVREERAIEDAIRKSLSEAGSTTRPTGPTPAR